MSEKSDKQPEQEQAEQTGSEAPSGAASEAAASEATAGKTTADSQAPSMQTTNSEATTSAATTPESSAAGSSAPSSPPSTAAEVGAMAGQSARSNTGAPAGSTTGAGAGSSAAPPSAGQKSARSVIGEDKKPPSSRTGAEGSVAAGAGGGSSISQKQKSTSKSPAASSSTGAPSASAPSSGKRQRTTKLGQLKLEDAKIGIIGAGKMADSLVQGLIHYAKVDAKRIHLSAPSAKNLERFKTYGCRVTKRNYDIFGRYDCDVIFLCFHGYVIKHCYKLGGAKPHPLTTNYIPHQRHPIYILSMVSGVSLPQIKACLLNPESSSRYSLEIHRIMMNTAVGHGLGICAIDCEPDSKKLSAPIRQLLSRISQLEHVPASQMDAACALGGSGLAFSFYFINALADGAFKMGLSRKQAIRFASKTAQCAAQTMLESGKHPAELRDTVSAPSGAAIYGIHVLEKNDVASGVTAAVEAAHKRAIDLATQEVT